MGLFLGTYKNHHGDGGRTFNFVSEPTRISDMDSNTKSGEPNIPTSQENITQLCKGQCGFFGTADNQGFCSVSIFDFR